MPTTRVLLNGSKDIWSLSQGSQLFLQQRQGRKAKQWAQGWILLQGQRSRRKSMKRCAERIGGSTRLVSGFVRLDRSHCFSPSFPCLLLCSLFLLWVWEVWLEKLIHVIPFGHVQKAVKDKDLLPLLTQAREENPLLTPSSEPTSSS